MNAFVDPELGEGVASLLLAAFLPLELCFAKAGFPSLAGGGVAVDLEAGGGVALDTFSGGEGVGWADDDDAAGVACSLSFFFMRMIGPFVGAWT